jgi:hypothetical protein
VTGALQIGANAVLRFVDFSPVGSWRCQVDGSSRSIA